MKYRMKLLENPKAKAALSHSKEMLPHFETNEI